MADLSGFGSAIAATLGKSAAPRGVEVCAMQVLECDAKKLLSRHAIVSAPGIVAATPEEAEAAATRLGPDPVFVKAQVGAGDRMACLLYTSDAADE